MNLEVLCVSMNQKDFSLIEKMNIQSDFVIANQTDVCQEQYLIRNGYCNRLISTRTLGVGKNRNISLIHAQGDILLFADDDVKYCDGYKQIVISEFVNHPRADVIIFNLKSNSTDRKQKKNTKFKKIRKWNRLPYGAPRIAVRKEAWEKSNVWFSTLFGGGAKYTNGEDSIFLKQLQKSGLQICVSNKEIGMIDMSVSSWYNGKDYEFYFNKGSLYRMLYPNFWWLFCIYMCFRCKSELSIKKRITMLIAGVKGYVNNESFLDWQNSFGDNFY